MSRTHGAGRSPAGYSSYSELNRLKSELSCTVRPADRKSPQYTSSLKELTHLRDLVKSLQKDNELLQRQYVASLSTARDANAGNGEWDNKGTPGQELLLGPEEIEEAALKCVWLATYWSLADHFHILQPLSAEKAQYWSALAPSLTRELEEMSCECAKVNEDNSDDVSTSSETVCVVSVQSSKPTGKAAGISTNSSASGSKTKAADDLSILSTSEGANRQATAGDIVEIERAMCQLHSMGVVIAVQAALMDSLQARIAEKVDSCSGFLEGDGESAEHQSPVEALVSLLGPEQLEEMAVLKHWCALMWQRAATAGIDPQISVQRAAYWEDRLAAAPDWRDMPDLAQSLEELRLLSIDQRLWQLRCEPSLTARKCY